MPDEVVESGTGIVDVIINDPIPPASGADDQKPIPADGAEAKKPEGEQQTPEQQAEQKLSRRQRAYQRERDQRIRVETEAKLLREERDKLLAERGKSQEPSEPKREEFQDYESYLDAKTEFKAKKVTSETLKADREANASKPQVPEEHQAAAKEWVRREKAFQAQTTDYDEVVSDYVSDDLGKLSDAARRSIIDSELGPQLLYHLASNPEVADDLAELSPRDQKAEIAKLAGSLTKPAGKAASDAPAPLKPVKPGRSAGNGFSDNMTDAEYREWRKGQGARWARH